jgi:ribonuclease VapC
MAERSLERSNLKYAMKASQTRRGHSISSSLLCASGTPGCGDQLDLFLVHAEIVVEPDTIEQIRIARKAWRRYGKGRGHAARLNFGDCFSYALAKSLGRELLYKGSDFLHTDVARAGD